MLAVMVGVPVVVAVDVLERDWLTEIDTEAVAVMDAVCRAG